jgi:DNA modification methylase
MKVEMNKIYNCDNIKGMDEYIDTNSIDFIITSPPYGQLRDYKGYSWNSDGIIMAMYRVLKPGGVCVWIEGDSVVDGSETGLPFEHALKFRRYKFNLHDTMIYEKSGSALPDPTRYLNCFEYMFVFSKGKPKTINFIKDRKNNWLDGCWGRKIVREKNGELTDRNKNIEINEYGVRFNIWRYNTGFGFSTKDKIAFQHPAIFPEFIARDHIISWSNEGDIVLDPFMGSGTTAKMAYLLNRKYIGFEISKEYCELAEKRLEPYLIQQSLF